MVQVLPQTQRRSFGDQINEGLQAAIPGIQQFMNQQGARQAAEKLGIDPAVLQLPEQAQAEYFKNAFSKKQELNPLQVAQMNLANEKTNLAKKKGSFLDDTISQLGVGEDNKQENLGNFSMPEEDNATPRPKQSAKAKREPNGLIPEDEIARAAVNFPNLANQMQHHNDKILEKQRHEEKMEFEKSKDARNYNLKVHKESAKYDEDLEHQDKVAKNQEQAIQSIRKAVQSGNVKPTSFANIFKGFGTVGDKLSAALLNGDEATVLTSIPQLLEGWKQVFGVRLTDADLKLLEDKLPSIGKSQEANEAVLGVLEKYNKQAKLRSKIGRDIKEQNDGLRPLSYSSEVEARFEEMMKPVRIITPYGDEVEIPAFELADALQSGGMLPND